MKPVETTRPMHRELCGLLPRMRRFARSLTGDPNDADDLVQIAVERALGRSAQWREEMSLEAWVFGIVRNAWIDEIRSRQRRWQVFAPEEAGEQVAAAHEDRATTMSVAAALAGLPDNQRVVVSLVLIEGLSYKEAAAALEVPIGTVTSRLARGRDALQRILGDSSQ